MSALEDFGIEYLIAVGFHAEPRYTKDLDVLIGVDAEGSRRLIGALKAFGAPVFNLHPEEFLEDDFVYFIGAKPWRVDILSSAPGVDFKDAYRDRITVELGGTKVNCISREWLLRAKRASGRHQDLADAEAIERGLDADNRPSEG